MNVAEKAIKQLGLSRPVEKALINIRRELEAAYREQIDLLKAQSLIDAKKRKPATGRTKEERYRQDLATFVRVNRKSLEREWQEGRSSPVVCSLLAGVLDWASRYEEAEDRRLARPRKR